MMINKININKVIYHHSIHLYSYIVIINEIIFLCTVNLDHLLFINHPEVKHSPQIFTSS